MTKGNEGWRALLLAAALPVFPLVIHGGQGGGDARAETYRAAVVNADGRLVITTADGRAIVVPKSPDQRSWGTPRLSDDRRAVGVQELHPNCCTSYALPLALVVFSEGTAHRFTGNGLPIRLALRRPGDAGRLRAGARALRLCHPLRTKGDHV